MADNAIDRNYDAVVEHLEDSADGVETHGAAVGVKQNDGPALRAALWALIGKPAGPNNTPPAVPGRKQLWDEAKANKVTTTAAWRVACSNGRALAMACVGALKPRLQQVVHGLDERGVRQSFAAGALQSHAGAARAAGVLRAQSEP